jgi:hypothetical protein
MLQHTVNLLGALVAGLCAVLLLRAYGAVGKRLLLWCGLCFLGLTLASVLLIVDQFLLPDTSLYVWRLGVAAASTLLMVYGLVFEGERP